MKKVKIVCHLTEYDTIEELTTEDKLLAMEAKSSTGDAYAPYSHFQVGAALLLENGKIIIGNNQENASYPVGLCAERVAIYAAGANYPGVSIKTMAISARSDLFSVNKPIPPCGACRQAIIEYENRYGKNIRIIMVGESGKAITSESIGNLLPFQFDSSDLKRRKK